ncbi:hypothetical protein TKK_0017761 [Trichogramma kaykai]|uniref:C2H2-type domain-containing protein n=1 Tax=Trichogramma kaykai TaxID=54128 RepID=A0ABD2W1P1_9HYME
MYYNVVQCPCWAEVHVMDDGWQIKLPCRKEFATLSCLEAHVLEEHQYLCIGCSQTFSDATDLVVHLEYTCAQCHAEFYEKSQLDAHRLDCLQGAYYVDDSTTNQDWNQIQNYCHSHDQSLLSEAVVEQADEQMSTMASSSPSSSEDSDVFYDEVKEGYEDTYPAFDDNNNTLSGLISSMRVDFERKTSEFYQYSSIDVA